MLGLFSYNSAVRECKRMNDSGGNGDYAISKRWYGWVVIDITERKLNT